MAKENVRMIDLPVDSGFMDPNFDGYKLSLENLPVKELALPFQACDLQPSNSQFSFEQAKIFAHAGQLHYDSWSSSEDSSVFIVNLSDGNFYRVAYNIEKRQWGEFKAVTSAQTIEGQALPPSIIFPAKDIAVLSNGVNMVLIYKTDEKRIIWEKIFEFCPFENNGIYIQDARLINNAIEVLVESVVEHEKESVEDHKVFDLVASWVTVNTITTPWQVTRKQDISLPGNINFITFDATTQHLIVISSEAPKVLADTDGLLSTETEEMEIEEAKKHYVWTEREDKVAVAFNLEQTVKKDDITVTPGVNTILVSIGGNVILNGKLGGHIQPDSATWTLGDSNKLEVTLFKRDSGVRWSFFVEGDQRGRYEMDPLLLEEATSALEKFSCDFKVPGGLGASENFNSEQMEECDMTDDALSTIYWYNKQQQAVVQRCDITGHQFLFEKKLGGLPSKLCIRYDVDGLLFAFAEDKMINEAGFAAFGYIQASKTNRRWCVSPPNNSYIVLAEATNHAFIYHQTSEVKTELLNRKTKEKIASVAKQQVINLKSRQGIEAARENKILSAHAENKVFYLLTEDILYAICVD